MKKILMLCFGVMAVMTSCQKEVQQFVGDYSYKMSGNIIVSSEDTTYEKSIDNVIGQLSIVKDDPSDKQHVMITMNEMNGQVQVLYGKVEGNELLLEEYEYKKDMILHFTDLEKMSIKVSGRGKLTDDILVIHEKWQGHNLNNETDSVSVSSDNILIVAQRN